jgi:glycine/D-amino acid oxidase-like deaminating enzyme
VWWAVILLKCSSKNGLNKEGMSKVIIIGGGIIGLSSALYLRKTGWEVTVIDKGDFSDNCSYGNAGYICPSHFIPLATPGIVKLGFKAPFMYSPVLTST